MNRSGFLLGGFVISFSLVVACSSSDSTPNAGSSGTAADGGSSGTDPDADNGSSGSSGGGGTQCTAARDQLLTPVAKVSKGEVKVVSEAGGVTTIYVDASAGGLDQARANPRTYITLAGARVDVTDKDAPASTDWDLALKRTTIFTNSGDAGPGKGGGAMVNKAFDAVTAAVADGVTIAPEAFFDADCNPQKDENADPQTSFTGWYAYDEATHIPTPAPSKTVVVKSAAGVRYKVGITSYQAKPDGGQGQGTGFFLLKVSPL